jgi:enoyl-CoA hydratase/carnithine racemase
MPQPKGSTMPETLKIERLGATALLLFDRPEVRHAVNYQLIDEAEEALGMLNRDDGCRALVLSGSGESAFCVGMDLNTVRRLEADTVEEWMTRLKRLYEAVRRFDKPCVAAVNGVAAGSGYQLALLADLRVGHSGARMGQTEINLGLASILGAHIMAPFLGHGRTVELTLSGRLMDGEECFRLGLFNYLVEAGEVRAKAVEAAEQLAQKPPNALRLSKQRLREESQAGFDAVFEAATRLQRQAFESGEPQQVMAEFFAKRG